MTLQIKVIIPLTFQVAIRHIHVLHHSRGAQQTDLIQKPTT